LSIWLFDCHQSEEIFWRRMNPARLHALFDARFRPGRKAAPAGGGKQSLSEYLRGG